MNSKYIFVLLLTIIIHCVISRNVFDCQSCAKKVKCCWYGAECKNGGPCCEKYNKPELPEGSCTQCDNLDCSVYQDPPQFGKTQCKDINNCKP
ncbi:hypothetical protein ACQ4LE_005053 [Meloidogyne hapla]